MVLFDFNADSSLNNWFVVDDVVMGGRSSGHMQINEEGHAVFFGDVSLDNYGGFSSIRGNLDKVNVESYSTVKIKLKGDGKQYQFRVKSDRNERFSYVYTFYTSGEWQTISILLSDMQPKFRGRDLDMPNYPNEELGEIAFLISNKKSESFSLEIDSIILE